MQFGKLGARFGRLGGVLGGAGNSLLAAPTLTWVSGTTDNTPDLTITTADIIVVGTDFTLEYASNSGFTSSTTVVHTLTAPESAAQAFNYALSALADGTWYIRVKYTGSAWSNTVTKTIDAAPTLTSPTGVKTGQTTATVGATTDQANGTLYWVVTTSATPPSAAQVKAGQNNGGTAASASGSQSITTTGVKTASATGLTSGTNYYAHLMHEDAGANQSNVVDSASFTTDSAVVVTFKNTGRSGDASNTIADIVVDIGTAAADRLVIVALTVQNAAQYLDLSCNGAAMTLDVGTVGTSTALIYSLVVPTGSGNATFRVTHSGSAGFTRRDISVWTATGLNSTAKKQSSAANSTTTSINVSAGDFLFAGRYQISGTNDFAGSTQAPGATHILSQPGIAAADWVIASSNASFAVTPGGTSSSIAAATYR